MKHTYLFMTLVLFSSLIWTGCDQQSSSGELYKTNGGITASSMNLNNLQTFIPASWSIQAAIDSTSFVRTTNGHFPIEIKRKPTRRAALFLSHGVAFISDGANAITHLEFAEPISDLPIGAAISAYEMDAGNDQIAKTVIEKTIDGYVTRVHFLSNKTPFNMVLVSVFDQNGDIEKPLFHKLIDRTQLEIGVSDVLDSGTGKCVGTEEEIDLCQQQASGKQLQKKQGSFSPSSAMALQRFCLPSSIANWAVDWTCYKTSAAQSLQKSTAATEESDITHLRFDFRPIVNPEFPTRVIEPQVVLSAITANMGVELKLAGYKTKTVSKPTTPNTLYFKEMTGLKFGLLSNTND